MIKSHYFTCLFIVFLFFSQENVSQSRILSDIESWYTFDFEKLSEKFLTLKKDTLLYRKYANVYISKARKNGDVIRQSNALFLLGKISDERNAIKYGDSIIAITKNIKDFVYPARAHLLKARNYGRLQLYSESLSELVIADNLASLHQNYDQRTRINLFIGILKTNLGEYEDALKRFKLAKNYYEKKFAVNTKFSNDYLRALFAVSNGHLRIKKYDSAHYYMKKGMDLSLQLRDSVYYGYFLLSSGFINHYKENYQSSIDSLTKFKFLFNNIIKDRNAATADLYLGKTYYKLNQPEKSIFFLTQIDSMPPVQMRASYELLLKIFKEKGDINKQVEYIDKILTIDSVINRDFKYLYSNIEKEYTTPKLIEKKEEIIDSLKKNQKGNRILIITLSIGLLLVISILLYNNHRKKIYKKRFLKLYDKQITQTNNQKEKQIPKDIKIPEALIQNLLDKLKEFEDNNDYLSSGLTIAKLATKFETNSRYLSKIINVFKGKSFSVYINDLRIEFAINKLENDTKFRKYTIKAIAETVGFSNPASFSQAFYKKTGIYPSFFLKELERQKY